MVRPAGRVLKLNIFSRSRFFDLSLYSANMRLTKLNVTNILLYTEISNCTYDASSASPMVKIWFLSQPLGKEVENHVNNILMIQLGDHIERKCLRDFTTVQFRAILICTDKPE
jgi:hypothetical protein